ncbi:MAG TPA: MoxR family ATPase [Steroidobacteraceae bacterium]|jgi:MoxR-like ATPase|nr:MoxR family ATPase [Steroidobacteraceae bacterium]
MSTPLEFLEQRLQESLGRSVIGLKDVIRALTIAVVARGHVLLQGPPGLGKTLLSKSLADALGGTFRRVQGTADLMPSDIIGVHVFDAAMRDFEFRPGPLFADVLLVDEINRASPKTQSALLEAMEERQVTVERQTYALPPQFLVIATQNPVDFEGTYPLPESQLDRFMLRVDMTYPQRDDEQEILARYSTLAAAAPNFGEPVAQSMLDAARAAVDGVHASPELLGYLMDLAQASRQHPHLTLGLSTRGALAALRAARITAALRGGDFVTPDDVKEVLPAIIAHRLVLAPEAMLEGITTQAVVRRILEQTPTPR